jgi:hypothetical protein
LFIAPSNSSAPIAGETGAYSNVVGAALDRDSFVRRLADAAADLNLHLLEVEDVEQLSERLRNWHVDPEIHELARDASTEPKTIHFGTFHTYAEADG